MMFLAWSRHLKQLFLCLCSICGFSCAEKEEGKEGVELGQYLYEIYNHNLEVRVSNAGVNLLMIKWMKELEKILYGNIVAYDAALGNHDELQTVIWNVGMHCRNVFSDDSSPQPSTAALHPVQAMTRYF